MEEKWIIQGDSDRESLRLLKIRDTEAGFPDDIDSQRTASSSIKLANRVVHQISKPTK